jgi:hypothetical protein
MLLHTAPTIGPTTTVSTAHRTERSAPTGFPPELPHGILPEVDWIHVFACRYGGAIAGARRATFNGRPIGTGVPSSSTNGGRWYSKAYLAGGAPVEGYPYTDGRMWDSIDHHVGGAVLDGRVLVVPLDQLERACRICQWWLAIRDGPGIVEWSPAFGTGPAGSFYGVRILARGTCWGRLAEVLGAIWRISIGCGRDRNHCVVSDTAGNVFASLDGALHRVGCTALAEALPLPKGPWRNHPTPPR